MTVQRILDEKGTHAPFVAPDVSISDVLETLEIEDVGALIVSTDGAKIDGIISERDVVRGLRKFGSEVLEHKVGEVMTTDVVTCTADDPISLVMRQMDERQIRHLPVVDKGKIAGIVSIRDVVKLRLGEVQSDADSMRAYISG